MSDWVERTIGDVANVFDGPHATPKKTASGPWFLSISSLDKGRLRLSESAHLGEEDFERWTRRVTPQEGDVLFSYETRLGDAALMPAGIRACLGRRMGLLRPNRAVIDPAFLLYAYLAPEFQAVIGSRQVRGATVDRIPLVELPSWPVKLPELREQKSICAVLGALDDKIAVNERIAATAESLALALASPERWDARVRLGELCTLSKKQVAPQSLVDDRVDHFSLPAFDGGKLPERINPGGIKSNKFLVSGGAVLLSKLNPDIPRVWEMSAAAGVPALASTEFLVLMSKGAVSNQRLWAVVAQPEFLGELASKVTGTSKSHQRVRPAEVLAADVVDPRQFGEDGEQISNLARTASTARTESATLATLRDTLLPHLMSGRLRVKDAEKIVEDHV